MNGTKRVYRRTPMQVNTVLKILWLALFIAGLNYVIVAYLNFDKPDLVKAWRAYVLIPSDRIFIMFGCALIVLSHFLPKQMLAMARRNRAGQPSADQIGASQGTRGQTGAGGQLGATQVPSGLAGQTSPVNPKKILFNYFVIKWALYEACSVMGFASAMAAHDISKLFPFVTAGTLGLLLSMPTQARIEAVSE